MRILHITETYASAGGIESYVASLVNLLHEAGCEGHLIFRQPHPRIPQNSAASLYCVSREGSADNGRQRIQAIIRSVRPDVVMLHAVYDPPVIADVARMAPTVGYIHTFYPTCPGMVRLFRRSESICQHSFGWGCVPRIYIKRCASARHPASVLRILHRASSFRATYSGLEHLIVANHFMENLLRQNGYSAPKITILPPHFVGNDIPPRAPLAIDKPLLFIGRLEIEKGLPYLLRALKLTKTARRLCIAGDGTLYHSYRRLVEELGLSHQTEFLGWVLPEQLRALYRDCSAVVMPSICAEPFGKVGLEAMAYGRPVIAFDVGGVSEWLKDGYNGFLVPSKDIVALGNRIDQILDNEKLANEIGRNGHDYARSHYSSSDHLSRLLAIFEEARSSFPSPQIALHDSVRSL